MGDSSMDRFKVINEIKTKEHFDKMALLLNSTWWAGDRTRETMVRVLENCLAFVVIDTSNKELVGFSRVMTDYIKFALICDVVVDPQVRKNGLGKLIIESIKNYPRLSDIQYFDLHCKPDKISFYEQLGFSTDFGTNTPMRFSAR